LEKLKSETKSEQKNKEHQTKSAGKKHPPGGDTPREKDDKEVLQSQISFGKFNITVKKKETMTAEELRVFYDKKFKIDESEKTAKLIVQEEDNDTIFEPMLENDTGGPGEGKKTLPPGEPKALGEKPPLGGGGKTSNVHRILSKFIDSTKEKWPDKTDILCWWCCHSFNTIPIPCPIEYDEIRNRYKVNGIFCSWSCAAAYSVKEYANLSLIYQMREEISPLAEDIVVAPPRFCLKAFGGYLSIKDYRLLDKNKTLLISTEGLSYINLDIAEIRTG